MAAAATLVQSSPQTRSWLQKLREHLPDLKYSEAEYYAAFRCKSPRTTVAYLNPAQRSVRLFLTLDPRNEGPKGGHGLDAGRD